MQDPTTQLGDEGPGRHTHTLALDFILFQGFQLVLSPQGLENQRQILFSQNTIIGNGAGSPSPGSRAELGGKLRGIWLATVGDA